MKSMTINHTVRNGEYYSLKGVKLTASALTLNAADLVSPVASRSVATVTLEQCFIGAKSTITMVGGGPAIELLKLNGSTTNNGRIDIRAGGPGSGTRTGTTYAEIHIGTGAGGARFENRGVIGESDGNNKFSSLNIVAEAGNATFINNGKINPTTINI